MLIFAASSANKKSSESVRDGGDQFDPFINLIAPKGRNRSVGKALLRNSKKSC